MSKVKEIKKIESKIKEIKKEKVESLDDEFDEDSESQEMQFISTNGLRRLNKTSTLDANEVSQTPEIRERRIAKEDEQEVNFRPSYTGGGNPYQSNSYTPVGSAESSGTQTGRSAGERKIDDGGNLQRNQEDNSQQRQGAEHGTERTYAGEREQAESRERRRR